MSDYLKTYKVSLRTVGPVFVGNGRELTKKEYMMLKGNRSIAVYDISRLYQLLLKKGLSGKFDDFLLNEKRADLRKWFQVNRINEKEAEPYIKYVLENGDTVLERGTKTQIMECVKDPYGNPYIPGSSIKGMFRTILLAGDVMQNPGKYRRNEKELYESVSKKQEKNYRNSYLKKETGKLEANFYRTLQREQMKPEDAVNDVLSGFIVSDSEPLKITDLVLCQKIDRHVDGSEKRLNLLRECIRPETEIVFELTIDTMRCPFSKEQIIAAAERFSDSYYDNFLCRYQGMGRIANDTIYLGGGCGYVSKTVTYPLFGREKGVDTTVKIFENTGVSWKHKHNQDRSLKVSPHTVKCTHYQGKTLPMGACYIERFEEFATRR